MNHQSIPLYVFARLELTKTGFDQHFVCTKKRAASMVSRTVSVALLAALAISGSEVLE